MKMKMEPFYAHLCIAVVCGVTGAVEIAILVSGALNTIWAGFDSLVVFVLFTLFGVNMTYAVQRMKE